MYTHIHRGLACFWKINISSISIHKCRWYVGAPARCIVSAHAGSAVDNSIKMHTHTHTHPRISSVCVSLSLSLSHSLTHSHTHTAQPRTQLYSSYRHSTNLCRREAPRHTLSVRIEQPREEGSLHRRWGSLGLRRSPGAPPAGLCCCEIWPGT